jgi:hypothetical protein
MYGPAREKVGRKKNKPTKKKQQQQPNYKT